MQSRIEPETAKYASEAFKHTSDNELRGTEIGFEYQEKELQRRHKRQGWLVVIAAGVIALIFASGGLLYRNGDSELAKELITHTIALAFGALGGWGLARANAMS